MSLLRAYLAVILVRVILWGRTRDERIQMSYVEDAALEIKGTLHVTMVVAIFAEVERVVAIEAASVPEEPVSSKAIDVLDAKSERVILVARMTQQPRQLGAILVQFHRTGVTFEENSKRVLSHSHFATCPPTLSNSLPSSSPISFIILFF